MAGGGEGQRGRVDPRLAAGPAGGSVAKPTSPTDERALPAIFLPFLVLRAESAALPPAALRAGCGQAALRQLSPKADAGRSTGDSD